MISRRQASSGDAFDQRFSPRRAIAGAAVVSLFLGGCSAQGPGVALKDNAEHFAESEYGVKASPLVAAAQSDVPRGGGRYKVGKPYKVKDRWYHPKVDPDYSAEGAASWYGSAFHGRLTANGEVYDMTHLTAAHPTMPLPSYARVTNLANDASVIVRVNDRGPFASNRVIDLSKRAAELLDYTHAGVAKVRVEYVGPAPLHGQDDHFLLASYQPGDNGTDSDGVMLAMNAPQPGQPVASALMAYAEETGHRRESGPVALPSVGPIIPDRPATVSVPSEKTELALLSYADQRVSAAAEAFDAILNPQLDTDAISGWWARRNSTEPAAFEGPYINLGSWQSRQSADRFLRKLSDLGRIILEEANGPNGSLYVASLVPASGGDIDETLRAVWSAGATDAFVIRK